MVTTATHATTGRARILTEATRLFAAQGFDGASLQAIADAAGLTKPAVLHHFASKDDLRAAVLADVLLRWNDVLPRVLVAATAGEHRFEALTHELLGFFAEDPDRARLVVREVLDRPEAMRRQIAEHVKPWVEVVADYVRKGQRSGEILRDVDPEAYVLSVIVLAIDGVATLDSLGVVLGGGEATRRERLTEEIVRLARAGLFAETKPPRGTETKGATTRAATKKNLPRARAGGDERRRSRS